MTGQYVIGPNTLRVEEDIIFLKSVGPFLLVYAREYARIAEQVLAERGRVFFVTDLSAAAMMPAETRRYFAEWSRQYKAEAVIYHGASLPLRAVATLLLSAVRRFSGGQRQAGLFVESEAEARAAITELKAQKTRA